jgi:hypothetical protein
VAARTPVDHLLSEGAAAVDDAVEVDVDHASERFRRGCQERPCLSDAGVVDENIRHVSLTGLGR